MKPTTEAAIAITCMLAMFSLGTWVSSDTITYKVEEDELKHHYVTYTGTFYRGEYRFEFKETLPKPEKYVNTSAVVNGRAAKTADGQKVIKIRTNRPSDEILTTCRHEVLHHYFPQYKHPDFLVPGVKRSDDPVYRLEDQVKIPVCQDAVTVALKAQG